MQHTCLLHGLPSTGGGFASRSLIPIPTNPRAVILEFVYPSTACLIPVHWECMCCMEKTGFLLSFTSPLPLLSFPQASRRKIHGCEPQGRYMTPHMTSLWEGNEQTKEASFFPRHGPPPLPLFQLSLNLSSTTNLSYIHACRILVIQYRPLMSSSCS